FYNSLNRKWLKVILRFMIFCCI
ncbi:hypothetical protein CPC197_0957, partial [Chlamydia psittaci C1/97]